MFQLIATRPFTIRGDDPFYTEYTEALEKACELYNKHKKGGE